MEKKDSLQGKIELKCPSCGKSVKLVRNAKGRWVATLSGTTVGGVIGAVVGAGIGIASGGWGMAATIPAGIALGTVLGGTGYIIGDKLVDKFKCPSCKETIKL